jgi:hypothetical protein
MDERRVVYVLDQAAEFERYLKSDRASPYNLDRHLWASHQAPASALTKSLPRSARVGWARFIAPTTRHSIATSR